MPCSRTVLDGEPPFRIDRTNLRANALIEIAAPETTHKFLAEVKANIDRHETLLNLRNFATQREGDAATLPFLVVTRFITREIAEECRKLELLFLDTAGNAYLKAPGLHVYVTGKKRPQDLTLAAEAGRTMTPAGLRILFAFLCNPHLLNATYRDIALTARVALGTIGPVLRDLETRKHITPALSDAPGFKRRILDPERLLLEWVMAYPAILRPKLNARRFRAKEPNWTEGVDLTPYHAFWGGEVAGARLTHYLAPQMATVYVQNPATRLMLDLRLKADIDGDVELLDVFWNPERVHGTGDVVPPILAYADLMTTADGRNLEVAKMIYDEFIGPHLRNQA